MNILAEEHFGQSGSHMANLALGFDFQHWVFYYCSMITIVLQVLSSS